MVTQLGEAILDLLKQCSAQGQMVKPLTEVKIQRGSTVPCEQWEKIKRFNVAQSNSRQHLQYICNNLNVIEDNPKNCRKHLHCIILAN